jgi:hypothetical protein
MPSEWSLERRRRQSQLIYEWKPWQRSTGPRTQRGKAQVSRNAYKGGVRQLARKIGKCLDLQEKWVTNERR